MNTDNCKIININMWAANGSLCVAKVSLSFIWYFDTSYSVDTSEITIKMIVIQ